MGHQSPGASVSLVLYVHHSFAQPLCHATTFFISDSHKGLEHVYQNTICQEAKRVNSIDTRQNQKIGLRQQMRLLDPNQQGEISRVD